MKFKILNKQKYLRNWHFWYKLIGALAILGMILGTYIADMIKIGELKTEILNWFNSLWNTQLTLDEFLTQFNEKFANSYGVDWISLTPILQHDNNSKYLENLAISASFGEFTIYNFSYFTVLSNLAVGVWFMVAAFKPEKEIEKGFVNYKNTLILTTYITITMLIWLTLLLPSTLINDGQMSGIAWFTGLSQHLVFPLYLILYVCFAIKPHKILTNKQYMQKEWWKLIVVVLAYGLYTLVRGELRYQGNRPYGTQYPYFFLRIHEKIVNGLPGIVWFIIAIVVIAGICLGFSIAYNTILLKRSDLVKVKNKNTA